MTKYFPHPVLGLADDVTGNIRLNILIERDELRRVLVFKILEKRIENEYFEQLIKSGAASLLFKVYCSSTFKTFNFLNPEGSFEIDENEICNKVEIEPIVVSNVPSINYTDKSFNEEFESQIFQVEKYDIIGILGKIQVAINKKYEKLGIGNLFVFEEQSDDLKALSFDLTLDKIHIKYPPTIEGEHPPNGMFHKSAWVAFNIFIVPALAEAFRIMQDDKKSDDIRDLEWYQILNDLLPETKRDSDPFISAQLVLSKDIPLIKAFEELCKS